MSDVFMEHWDLHEFGDCLAIAWAEVKDRRGRMVDGIFVKGEASAISSRTMRQVEHQKAYFEREDARGYVKDDE